jgi:hypothetical protein
MLLVLVLVLVLFCYFVPSILCSHVNDEGDAIDCSTIDTHGHAMHHDHQCINASLSSSLTPPFSNPSLAPPTDKAIEKAIVKLRKVQTNPSSSAHLDIAPAISLMIEQLGPSFVAATNQIDKKSFADLEKILAEAKRISGELDKMDEYFEKQFPLIEKSSSSSGGGKGGRAQFLK